MKLHSVTFLLSLMMAGNANAAVSCHENALGAQNCTNRASGETMRGRIDAMGNQKFTTNTGKTIKSRVAANGTTVYTDKSGARTTCRKNANGATVCRNASGGKITCRTNAVGHTICK
ncbi:MAG: hypothetical protein Q4E56_01085 [Pseudomonadota bacterium]|nr:hypothetical protein [Pseudomonadota bacterium]